MMIDEQFLNRVYRSSIGWSALILSYLMMSKLVSVSVGFAIGVGLALGVLRAIETIVKKVVVPGGQVAAKGKMMAFGVAKYFILAVTVALIVKSGWVSLPAFACGIGVPSTVVFLKTLAHFFSEIEFHPFWGSSFDPRPVRETE